MKYLKFVKTKHYFDDTYIFMGMLLLSLIQRLLVDIFEHGLLMAAIVEVIMIVFIYCRIKKIKKENDILKCGQLVYGVYDKEYMNVLPYAGRGGLQAILDLDSTIMGKYIRDGLSWQAMPQWLISSKKSKNYLCRY